MGLRPDDMSLIDNAINGVLTDYVVLNKNDILDDLLSRLSIEELGYYVILQALAYEPIDNWYKLPNYEELSLDDDLIRVLVSKNVIEYNESERKVLFKC